MTGAAAWPWASSSTTADFTRSGRHRSGLSSFPPPSQEARALLSFVGVRTLGFDAGMKAIDGVVQPKGERRE